MMDVDLKLRIFIACAVAAACGGDPKPQVIAVVGDEPEETGESSEELDELALKDAKEAASILKEAILGEDRELAAWAAVYARRLGIDHDEAASMTAIEKGTASGDILLACLCYRWLATSEMTTLPKRGKGSADEPVMGTMIAAASVAVGQKIPKELKNALALPAGKPRKDSKAPKKKLEIIGLVSAPYDNGPLALAISFAMSVRNGWTEDGDWAARGLRDELMRSLGKTREDYEKLLPAPVDDPPPMTRLTDRLDLAITSQTREMLRKVAVNGAGGLRIDALRALAVVAREPEAGDLGAAAAAMRSDDPVEKVEAARTFLLLAARSTR